MFGSSGGMFGNKSFTSNTSSFGSTFGTTTYGSNDGPDGTTIAFEPMRGTDTMIRNGDNKEIQTKNMCITSMDQYKMKSIEELRVADYAANRKGNTGGGGGGGLFASAAKPAGTGLFGSTASSFGQQPQPSTGSNLFGANTNTGTTGSLFGSAAKPAGTGLFGSTASSFGQQQQPSTGSNLFGANTNTGTTGSLFGSAAKPAGTGLFGSTASTFGQQQQPSTGSNLFGGTNTGTTGSLFGSAAKPAGTGLFGSTASTFGQQQQPSTGSNLFGGTNTGTTGSLFGSAAKPAGLFGSNTTSTFGQQQQPSTGSNLFGGTNTSTTGSLFGSTAKPAGLFGSNTTSTFGQQQQQQPTQQFAAAPTSAPVQPIYLGGKDDENAIKRAILESQLSSLPYGDSPVFKNKSALPGISSSSVLSRNNESSNIQSQLRKLANQALSPTSSPSNNTSSNGNTSALNNLSNGSTILSPNASFSYKPLVGLPSLGFDPGRNQSSLNLSLRSSPQKLSKNNSFMSDSKKQHQSLKSFDVSVLKSTKSNASKPSSTVSTPPTADAEILTPQQSRRRSVCFADVPNLTQVRTTDSTTIVTESTTTTDATLPVAVPKKSILVTPETRRPREVTTQSPITPPTFSETTTSDSVDMNNSSALNSSILLAEGYYVEPPIEELENSLKDGKYFVHGGLTVGRNGYGSVFWPGDFELSSLNFEDIISFRSKEVVVYPDDESKPPLGVDLNRPAEVSLERVWPFDKETKEYIKDPTTLGKLQFRARLERACNRMDARFIDYQVTTGTWTFGVSHFSKYGLVDDEDDDPMMTVEQMQALQRQKNQMSKIQRLPLEKKSFPLREIQSDYSFAASGLGGGFVDPMIKYEGKTFGVTLNDDLDDEPRDFKRIRLDHDVTSELLESKPSFAELVIPTFSRQKLVPRECDEKILEVSKNKLLRLRYQNVRSRAEALYLKTVRPQWHPSEPMTILSQSETNCFVTKKITAVPLLKTYFENYLESDGRIEELPKILQSPALNFNPPSVLIDLLDAHILSLKRDSTIADDEAEKQIKSLCAAILLSPSAPNYGIQQRRRLGDWIRKMLAPSLKIILKNVSDDDENLATRVIYECLVHGNVKEAAAQAIRFKYFNLALFISLHNCSTSNDCKKAFALQYSEADRIFQNGNKDKYMMSIYQMFGGPKNLKAALSDPHSVLCFNGLSWLQIFGIFIWYGTSPADTLADLY